MTETPKTIEATGRCHCGDVTYEIRGPMRQVVECHCESCRRLTGSIWHATGTRLADLEILDPLQRLSWYDSSETVKRGFCGNCGSCLFFKRDGADTISITAGTLDQPTGLNLMVRIFLDDAADYATRQDLPEYPQLPPMEMFAIPEK